MNEIKIIGAGLAGCEAALQLASRNISVKLFDCKNISDSKLYKSQNFAELVCSNSLGSKLETSASGLMKKELSLMGSFLIEIAYKCKVKAGQALAVDREMFSELVTQKLSEFDNIEIIEKEILDISEINMPMIITSGPLTTQKFSENIKKYIGEEHLYFYDAVSPIITSESIDREKVYLASRYDKGEADYLNCPFTKEEYEKFYNELIKAECIKLKEFENIKLFEGCMPIENIAKRGEKTLLFGPLKPIGLINPKTNSKDHAVVQLRREDNFDNLYNLVGFQTNLKWNEQKRVFRMIPGLEKADFVRCGVMHKNTYINSSKLLNKDLTLKKNNSISFAGQITGSEGYVAAIGTGLMSAINVYRKIKNMPPFILNNFTQTGAMIDYITTERKKFQPMGPNFGIMPPLDERIKDKRERYQKISERSIDFLISKIQETTIF